MTLVHITQRMPATHTHTHTHTHTQKQCVYGCLWMRMMMLTEHDTVHTWQRQTERLLKSQTAAAEEHLTKGGLKDCDLFPVLSMTLRWKTQKETRLTCSNGEHIMFSAFHVRKYKCSRFCLKHGTNPPRQRNPAAWGNSEKLTVYLVIFRATKETSCLLKTLPKGHRTWGTFIRPTLNFMATLKEAAGTECIWEVTDSQFSRFLFLSAPLRWTSLNWFDFVPTAWTGRLNSNLHQQPADGRVLS